MAGSAIRRPGFEAECWSSERFLSLTPDLGKLETVLRSLRVVISNRQEVMDTDLVIAVRLMPELAIQLGERIEDGLN